MREVGLPIREFVYFDREKVEDFASALLGGLPAQRKEGGVTKSPRWDVGIAKLLKFGRRGGSKELTREEVLNTTDASLFERFHLILKDTDAIQMLDAFDSKLWDELHVGDFVELPARVELSALEGLFDLLTRFSGMVEIFSREQAQDASWQAIVSYVRTLVEQTDTYNVRVIPLGAPSEGFMFVALLSKGKARVSRAELAGEFTVFGRIQRKLVKDESIELFSIMPAGMQLPRQEMPKLLSNFENMPAVLGPAPTMKDFIVSYPAVILTPVAIFR